MPATASTFETLDVATAEGICTITMNRPAVYNALNDQLTFELHDALKTAPRDRDVSDAVPAGREGTCGAAEA